MTDFLHIYHGVLPPWLLEAAQAPGLLRLQDVSMHCGCHYTAFPRFQGLPGYCRYDHCLGVAAIVWHFTGSREAALAGLVHDMATPVFSHVVDFLYGDAMTQERTEEGTLERIQADPVLGQLLTRWKIPPEALYPTEQHPIADNPSPQLAADRLEYTLHNGVDYGICTPAEAAALYEDLTVGENEKGQPELMFRSREAAMGFSRVSLACSGIYVAPEDRYAMEVLSNLLSSALRQEVLEEKDLHTGEAEVIRKLEGSSLAPQWNAFRAMRRLVLADQPGPEPMWRQIKAKKRAIDPMVLGAGRLSDLDEAYCAALQAFRGQSQEEWMYCPSLKDITF